MKVTVSIKISGSDTRNAVAADFERTGPLKAASLSLSIDEAKAMLWQVQQQIVEAQFAEHDG